MTNKKKKTAVSSKYLALPFALAIVLLVVVFMLSKKQPKQVNEVTETPSPLTETKVEETIENGVYTNYTYGFSFEYPDEIFNKINPWSETSGGNFFVEGQRFPQLSVRYWAEDYYSDFYSECFTSNNGAILSESKEQNSGSKKMYNIGDICVSIVIPFYEKYSEEPWNYSLAVPSNNIDSGYIAIYLSGASLSKTQELEDEFDSIVKSFKFIAPSN